MRTIENTSDSKSKDYKAVDFPIYTEVTDINDVPFENDIQEYTSQKINE